VTTARVRVFLDQVRSRDVRGHQVGGELDPGEAQVEDVRDGLDEKRLGEPRHADEERIATDEEGEQHLLDHRLLPNDPLPDLGENGFACVAHPVREREIDLALDAVRVLRLLGQTFPLTLEVWIRMGDAVCAMRSLS